MKHIKSVDGRLIQVSDEDFEYLNKDEWIIGSEKAYVRKSNLMYRVIVNRKEGKDCNDLKIIHIDNNRLNNQRENIKVKK